MTEATRQSVVETLARGILQFLLLVVREVRARELLNEDREAAERDF